MKALSIKEPWASMIRSGDKTIETRTWAPDYRGPLLLCASKRPAYIRPDSHRPRYRSPIAGKAFAVADLVECRKMTVADERAACCDLYSGAVAWVLDNVRLIEPFPVRGQLGLFEVDMESRRMYIREISPTAKQYAEDLRALAKRSAAFRDRVGQSKPPF